MSLLSVEDIRTAYGLSQVLFGISLEVEAGECVCLLGRNGVGKTTTMRSIMGLTPPRAGRVVWRGQDIAGWPPLPDRPRRDRLRAGGSAHLRRAERVGEPRRRRPRRAPAGTLDHLDRSASCSPCWQSARDQRGGFLSGGEQQMLTIARTLMGNPELLLLDEPSEGLAPLVVDLLRDKIGELKAQGLTILLAEQGVEFSLALADRVYVLEKGAVRHAGPAAELREDPALLNRLLALEAVVLRPTCRLIAKQRQPIAPLQYLHIHTYKDAAPNPC